MRVVWAYHQHRTSARSGPPLVSHAFHGKVAKFHHGTFLPDRNNDGTIDETSLCKKVLWQVSWSGTATPAPAADVCTACQQRVRKLRAGKDKPAADKRPTAWEHILRD